jgi:hypothetical protein
MAPSVSSRCWRPNDSSSVVRLEAIDAERDRRDAIVDLYLALGAS